MGFFNKLAEAVKEGNDLANKDITARRKREAEEERKRIEAIRELQERERRNKR